MIMKVFNLVRLAALLVSFAGVGRAQNLLTPGELTRSPFDAGVEAAPVMPKGNIAYVETNREKRMREVWIGSIAAMMAGTAADAFSSWHKQEGNGMLASSNGTFGGKGVAIKAG